MNTLALLSSAKEMLKMDGEASKWAPFSQPMQLHLIFKIEISWIRWRKDRQVWTNTHASMGRLLGASDQKLATPKHNKWATWVILKKHGLTHKQRDVLCTLKICILPAWKQSIWWGRAALVHACMMSSNSWTWFLKFNFRATHNWNMSCGGCKNNIWNKALHCFTTHDCKLSTLFFQPKKLRNTSLLHHPFENENVSTITQWMQKINLWSNV